MTLQSELVVEYHFRYFFDIKTKIEAFRMMHHMPIKVRNKRVIDYSKVISNYRGYYRKRQPIQIKTDYGIDGIRLVNTVNSEFQKKFI